jgi:hypothetical protein
LIKVSSFQTEYMVKMSLTVLKKKKGWFEYDYDKKWIMLKRKVFKFSF